MTLELESYRSSNSLVLMHAPLDMPEGDRRNVGISTVARRRRLSKDDARSRHTSAPLVRVSTPVWPSSHSESWDFGQPPVATEGRVPPSRRFLAPISPLNLPAAEQNLISGGAEEQRMSWTLSVVGVAALALSLAIVLRIKRLKDQSEMERHSITAEELHALLASDQEVLLFNVRQPLDLLAYPEIIPKARRIAPNEVLEKPSLIPNERDAVVCCTCPSDKTSRTVLHLALALQFFRVKFLKGGLAAWKVKGYPVESYQEVFHLYTPSLAPGSR